MKRLISLILTVLIAQSAYALDCQTQLMPAFTPQQANALCLKLGLDYASDFNFITGKSIAIQEATAASACSGTLTCNGATDVVTSTTCSTTGSRIFLQRSSADTDGVGQMYLKSISTGVSFTVNCVTAADTSTVNWIIFHEAP